jgi:hypothetical protein
VCSFESPHWGTRIELRIRINAAVRGKASDACIIRLVGGLEGRGGFFRAIVSFLLGKVGGGRKVLKTAEVNTETRGGIARVLV